ncbi:leucine-rich repeat protein [Perkinsela sp. CCAP 1560/4]|nr:leucine-rich repeat protein [Perkinsela sp. CCAP 1560/4]|eukprot:KNH03880.1 leucine-rich repeat protein [Perkinsela sp. CCAP 1560/4]
MHVFCIRDCWPSKVAQDKTVRRLTTHLTSIFNSSPNMKTFRQNMFVLPMERGRDETKFPFFCFPWIQTVSEHKNSSMGTLGHDTPQTQNRSLLRRRQQNKCGSPYQDRVDRESHPTSMLVHLFAAQ